MALHGLGNGAFIPQAERMPPRPVQSLQSAPPCFCSQLQRGNALAGNDLWGAKTPASSSPLPRTCGGGLRLPFLQRPPHSVWFLFWHWAVLSLPPPPATKHTAATNLESLSRFTKCVKETQEAHSPSHPRLRSSLTPLTLAIAQRALRREGGRAVPAFPFYAALPIRSCVLEQTGP